MKIDVTQSLIPEETSRYTTQEELQLKNRKSSRPRTRKEEHNIFRIFF